MKELDYKNPQVIVGTPGKLFAVFQRLVGEGRGEEGKGRELGRDFFLFCFVLFYNFFFFFFFFVGGPRNCFWILLGSVCLLLMKLINCWLVVWKVKPKRFFFFFLSFFLSFSPFLSPLFLGQEHV